MLGHRQHSIKAYDKMIDIMYDMVISKKKSDLNTINPATQRLPFVSITADKATINSKQWKYKKIDL